MRRTTRRVARGALKNPRRLTVTTAAAVGLVVFMLIPTRGCGLPDADDIASGAAAPLVEPAPTFDPDSFVELDPTPFPTPTVSPEVSPDPGMDTWVDPGGSTVAAADTVEAWLAAPDLTQAAWLAGLQPHVTDELLQKLGFTDTGNVPDADIDGQPVITEEGPMTYVTVPTTAGPVLVGMVYDTAGWKAARLLPG